MPPRRSALLGAAVLLSPACTELEPMPSVLLAPAWSCDEIDERIRGCNDNGCAGLFSMTSLIDDVSMDIATQRITTTAVVTRRDVLQTLVVDLVTPYYRGTLQIDQIDTPIGVEHRVMRVFPPEEAAGTSNSASMQWSASNSEAVFTLQADMGVLSLTQRHDGQLLSWIIGKGQAPPLEGCAYLPSHSTERVRAD